jgi:hypothetical protein
MAARYLQVFERAVAEVAPPQFVVPGPTSV